MKCLFALATLCLIASAVARAPLTMMESSTRVPDQYIVVLHTDVTVELRDQQLEDLTLRFSGKERIINRFDIGSFIGYSAVLSKDNLVKELEHPNVRYIEADQTCSVVAEMADGTSRQTTGATWGLNRISQANAVTTPYHYDYWTSGGHGVHAYIIDTGILLTHTDFGGRAIAGVRSLGDNQTSTVDDNGHGTHCASTTGGTTYGVAKHVTLVSVKVLNSGGSGSWAGVIGGVDWVTKNHTERGGSGKAWSVANMSLGGAATPSLDAAVNESMKVGVHYALAAGNDNGNACNTSPARTPLAITAGASNSTDSRASFSNWGACVDIFAPGQAVLAAYIGSNTATASLSGTSMASPHVCGVMAIQLGHELANGAVEPPTLAEMDAFLKKEATVGKVLNPGNGSPNLLLFSPFSEK